MRKSLRTLLSVGLLAVGLGSTTSSTTQAAFVNFDVPGDLSSKFFGANSSGATSENYAEEAGTGISGSRAINSLGSGGGYTTLINTQESFALANIGDSITVSAFAKRQNDANTNNDSSSFLRVGITDGSNDAVNRLTGGSGNAMALDVFINLATPADFTDVVLRYSNKVGTVAFSSVAGGASTLTNGNWYKLTATFTNVGAGNISISGLLENYGTTGTSIPTTVRTIAASSFANTGLVADTTLWGAVLARQDGGSDVLDNFSASAAAVPEPGMIGLLAATGLCGMLVYRRRAAN